MQWLPAEAPPSEAVAALAAAHALSPVAAEIVARRLGHEPPGRFLHPAEAELTAPECFPGMAQAVARIRRALAQGEAITIFGDYDADGITGTVLLVQALTSVKSASKIRPFFPKREGEGYGLSKEALSRCFNDYPPKPSLLVTVDCGITAVQEVAWLAEQGVETLITDHHTPPERLPQACAIINPRFLPEGHAAHDLCGCATAFTLVRALERAEVPIQSERYLDLVAVATIADIMPLTGDNRSLVVRGLRLLASGQGNLGLFTLHNALRKQDAPEPLTAEAVAFGIVPCINAAGRVGSQLLAQFQQQSSLRCNYDFASKCSPLHRVYALFHASGDAAKRLAEDLKALNRLRKTAEADLCAKLAECHPAPGAQVMIAVCPELYAGVAGIVAARLMRRAGVPTVVLCRDGEGPARGSMRVCGQWHAVEALRSVEDLLSNYGGHAKAAGFVLRPGTYEAFCRRLSAAFQGERQVEVAHYEADLSTLASPYLLLHRELAVLEPLGHGNPKPVFRATFRLVHAELIGKTREHLALRLQPIPGGNAIKALWFGHAQARERLTPGSELTLFFTLACDTFRAVTQPVLMVEDIAPAEVAPLSHPKES